jgi:putative nucleotidyltransferase with HDIG domain
VWATTVPVNVAQQLRGLADIAEGASAIIDVDGESWAVRRVNSVGSAAVFALASIDTAAGSATWDAIAALAWIAVAALALGGFGSVWLAQTITGPIDQLSASATSMSAARRFTNPLPVTGTSRELDALTKTLNALMNSVAEAEAETQAAYLGAIRALATALDARDPYTAGHSERVSALSVEIGRALRLDEAELDTLRLGALLHDIGKIGVPDEVLRKSGALSAAEFGAIKTHPSAGARILRSIPFLAPHIPMVELHHERPDGLGYPYGLRGAEIPLAARIVHVADAFDAMTSARAYRAGRMPVEAIAELRRCVGSDFDGPSVDALIAALPRLVATGEPLDPMVFQWAPRARSA